MRIGYYTARIYTDDLDPQDIPECTFPVSDTKPLNKIMKRWERLHIDCASCTKPCEMAKQDIDYDNQILIVKVKVNTPLKTEVLQKVHETILEQKKTGVVVLPSGYNAILVPKDLELQVENGDEI